MFYFVIDFLSRTISSLLNLLPCSPASGKNRNPVYLLQTITGAVAEQRRGTAAAGGSTQVNLN